MSSWRADTTAFALLGGGGTMVWASFVGVLGSAESVGSVGSVESKGSVGSVESKYVCSTDGVSIVGAVCWVVHVLVSISGVHVVRRC